MYSYNWEKLEHLLSTIIYRYTDPSTFPSQFSTAFMTVPRKTGRTVIDISQDELENIAAVRTGFTVKGWTIDRLARVWMLMQLDTTDKDRYFRTIENLFLTGEMNELVALYSALPVLAYPEMWTKRCAEGIRNNIGDVLESIMCNNPYPSENLDESAWNQLVLKAFFTEKPMHQVIGLNERANEKLAHTLYDYACERRAAGRTINPVLWQCIEPFANETTFPDYQKIKDYVLQSSAH